MNIKKEREKMGISQFEMSNLLDIAHSTYCQYENGTRNIPTEKVDLICSILKIDRDAFFTPLKFAISK